jgi:hypothetical protein
MCTNGKMSIPISLPLYWQIYPLYQMSLAQSSVIHFESEGRSTFTHPFCPVPLDCEVSKFVNVAVSPKMLTLMHYVLVQKKV